MVMYRIIAKGCDEVTTVDLDLTEAGVATANRIADATVEASTSGCMPRLRVIAHEDIEDLDGDKEAEEDW